MTVVTVALDIIEVRASDVPWGGPKGEYRAAVAAINQEYKVECLKEFGLTDHPKAEAAWEMAWENGHSEGLHAVAWHVQDLAKLILD